MNKAIDKIRDEMAANARDEYIQYVGAYLTDYVQQHPRAAEKLLQTGKTIKGSLEKMRDYASNIKKGNIAVVTPDVGFGIVLNYFGLDAESAVEKTKSAGACGFELDLDLDELLGEG